MQSFYNSFGFLIAFMILLLIFQMMMGPKFTETFMLLVLASMVVVNSDKVEILLQNMSQKKED